MYVFFLLKLQRRNDQNHNLCNKYVFAQVLSLFMMGYALLTTAMNQPFGFPDDYTDNETNPDALDFETLLTVITVGADISAVYIFSSVPDSSLQ